MKTALFTYHEKKLTRHPGSSGINEKKAQLVLCFGAKSIFQNENVYQFLKDKFPSATIATCSTSGEIYHTSVLDDTLSITAVEFDSTVVKSEMVSISDYNCSYHAGKELIEKFNTKDLSYVLVLSDGSKVNGSELVRGMNEVAQQRFLVTGGLAGDGSNFQSTLVGINNNPKEGLIVGIGLYGKNLKVKHGSQGGWEMFGLEKTVTRSANNVLFEMEGKNALEIYKHYLGPEAESLPGSALLFPLAVKLPGVNEPIVRTILSIDEASGSMTFAGDIPVGSKVRFMKANFDKLTNAASGAAAQTQINGGETPGLALLISCVGRKLILQSRIDEEVEAVNGIFSSKTLLTGFYSYGEISPLDAGNGCQLHNQTMTITTFHETEQAA